MPLTISSVAHVDSVYLIKSVKPHEDRLTRRFPADLESLLQGLGAPFSYQEPADHDDLTRILDGIAVDARGGRRPVLQFYLHGNPTEGFYIANSGEFYDWQLLAGKLRAINIATGNNLCVVSAVCFGINVIRQNSIHDAVMSYGLIAPEKTISIDFVETELIDFYKDLFSGLDLHGAYERHLSGLHFFHCERLLVTVLARYFKYNCMGDGLARRIDSLLEAAAKTGVDVNEVNRPALMAMLEREAAPSNATFQRYASIFLAGRCTNVTFGDVMDLIQADEHGGTAGG